MEFIGFGIVALIFISIFFISGVINERNTFRLYKERLQKEYGAENKREWKDEEFCHIGGYFKKHKEEYQLDEITWNDLNMDDIFKQIDYAKSLLVMNICIIYYGHRRLCRRTGLILKKKQSISELMKTSV